MESAVRYDYADAVREKMSITLDTDSDDDGSPDRLVFDIVRPRTSGKVPVILEQSPYYGTAGRGSLLEDKKRNAVGAVVSMPLFYDNYFVPRGYAFVALDSMGSGLSGGCADDLGPRVEAMSNKIIHFLSGAGTATDSTGKQVRASWSSGAIGMIGKSMDGSYPLAVAAGGNPALKTVVSISGLSDIYAFREARADPAAPFDESNAGRDSNSQKFGACQHSDDALTAQAAAAGADPEAPFWQDRRHLAVKGTWTAATLMVSGVRDYTVPSSQALELWKSLGSAGVPRMWWVTQAAHDDPFDIDRAPWVSTLHRWFDHYLMGLDTGIDTEPPVRVQQDDLSWRNQSAFPAATATTATWAIGRKLAPGVSREGSMLGDIPSAYEEVGLFDLKALSSAVQDPPSSLLVVSSAALTRPLHLSGVATVSLPVRASQPGMIVYAKLVDVGPGRAPVGAADAINDLSVPLAGSGCWGESTPADSACYPQRGLKLAPQNLSLIARARTFDAPSAEQASRFTISLTPMERVVAAGHRLVLVIGVQGPRPMADGSDSGGAGSLSVYPGTLTLQTLSS